MPWAFAYRHGQTGLRMVHCYLCVFVSHKIKGGVSIWVSYCIEWFYLWGNMGNLFDVRTAGGNFHVWKSWDQCVKRLSSICYHVSVERTETLKSETFPSRDCGNCILHTHHLVGVIACQTQTKRTCHVFFFFFCGIATKVTLLHKLKHVLDMLCPYIWS